MLEKEAEQHGELKKEIDCFLDSMREDAEELLDFDNER